MQTDGIAFRIKAMAFPSAKFASIYQNIGAIPAKRSTETHPIWKRLDGAGFTIWISEAILFDSIAYPPVWEIRVESLYHLNESGKSCWSNVIEAMSEKLSDLKLSFEVATEDGQSEQAEDTKPDNVPS